ncbi:MAG: apolipoprotein acyltransferase [Planctomycetota bacterium]
MTDSETLSTNPSTGLLERMQQRLPLPAVEPLTSESLVGFFQNFRGDNYHLLHGFYEGFPGVESLAARLNELYQAAGDGRRPGGGRDAYFVVRNPLPMEPDEAERLALAWVGKLAGLARTVGRVDMVGILERIQHVRVLEGIPPKHPKAEVEKCRVLLALQDDFPELILTGFLGEPSFEIVHPAYYYICCDSYIAAHLIWPLLAATSKVQEPFEDYFRLWKHGIKYRVFADEQLDLYLPRI